MLAKLIDSTHIRIAHREDVATPEARAARIAEGYRPLLLSTERPPFGTPVLLRYEALGDYIVKFFEAKPAE